MILWVTWVHGAWLQGIKQSVQRADIAPKYILSTSCWESDPDRKEQKLQHRVQRNRNRQSSKGAKEKKHESETPWPNPDPNKFKKITSNTPCTSIHRYVSASLYLQTMNRMIDEKGSWHRILRRGYVGTWSQTCHRSPDNSHRSTKVSENA